MTDQIDPDLADLLFLLQERQTKGSSNYYKPLGPRMRAVARAYWQASLPAWLQARPSARFHVLVTSAGLPVARGWTRVVVGDYGAYLEFAPHQVALSHLTAGSGGSAYNWLRSRDSVGIKVYEQLRTVLYADYKPGFYYIAPSDVHRRFTIISGGQTGADQGGLAAAVRTRSATGGWVPTGWRTDEGPAPWLAKLGLLEHSPGYPDRTRANVEDSDATLIVGNLDSPGCRLTRKYTRALEKPVWAVAWTRGLRLDPDGLTEWLYAQDIQVLNVAGNRERMNPGIRAAVSDYVTRALIPF